jgi:hypothetical protein
MAWYLQAMTEDGKAPQPCLANPNIFVKGDL